jgi:hypothetical protein
MSVTILDALKYAEYNFQKSNGIAPMEALGKRQLHTAVALLLKDYPLHEKVEPLLQRYGDVDNVPNNQVY